MLENHLQHQTYPVSDWNAATTAVRAQDIVSILGAQIANLSYDAGFRAIIDLLDRRRAAFAADSNARGTAKLFFCNANTLSFARENPGYRDVLNRSDYLFGDGTGVRLAAAMRGVRMKANLNGTDLVPELLRVRQAQGDRVFILGGEEDANRTAAEYLRRAYPGLVLAGRHHGFWTDAQSEDVVREINAVRPDLLLVGMGHPRQEQWIDAQSRNLKVPLTIAVGGLFAYWGNGLKRASSLSRRLGFEWLEILFQQPHKAQRYLVGSPIFLTQAALAVPSDLRVMRGQHAK